MATTVADALLERLRQWGVERVFGYPGDGINGIMGAFNRAGGSPELIQARHEEMAALMACGHAKFTGEVGVCTATSGPGAIHLLNGLYDARLDHQPVLAIVGQQATTALGSHYQQEVDLASLFKDVASEYLAMVTTPEQLDVALDRAMRTAAAGRTVTCLIVPNDVQEKAAVDEVPHAFKVSPGSVGVVWPRVTPDEADLRRAADVLNAGERVAILVGQGARHAADEVVQVADALGAGVAKALLGKDVLDDDLPFVTGAIGLLGTRPSFEMMAGCDTLLMVGSSFPYGQFLPEWGQARGVQIDIDPRLIGIRYPMELNLVGDSKATLEALIPLLRRKVDRAWRETIEESVAAWWRVVEERAMSEADPINPQRVFWELSPHLPDDVIVCGDSGSSTNWYARDVKLRRGMRASLSGTLATMGSAVPYAVGAKFAHPTRPVVALEGDGAMQMNGNAELLTVAKYWRRWEDPRFVVLVLHNNDLNQVTWEQRAMEGDPKFEASQDLPDFDYAGYAELCGLQGIRVERPDEIAPAWERAFSSSVPTVIDALASPDVPPIPPHIEWKQVKAVMSSLLTGDPDAAGIVRQLTKQSLVGILPGRRT
jgi:pyruvate dehydrogenase (quinone)